MPHKITFSVIFSSSEVEAFRGSELNTPTPTTSGWRSAPHAPFPQELILLLHAKAALQRVQLLAHQYLIPSRVEFFVGDCDEDQAKDGNFSQAAFQYLGFVTLSDNQGTAFQARELKSVTLPCCGRLLKLVLHANHPNDLNVHEQVSLMALSLLGQWTEDNNNSLTSSQDAIPPPQDDVPDNAANNNSNVLVSNPQYTSPYDDLAFDMYVDPEAAKIIRQMERRKQEAVMSERFEYARKLKQAMEELRRAGERLGKFELEKRQAISMEHFGKAKLKKAQMDDYREQVYNFLEIPVLLELNGYQLKNDAPVDTSKRRELPPPPRLRPKSRDPSPHAADNLHLKNGNIPNNARNGNMQFSPPGVTTVASIKRRGARNTYEAYEERALPALKNNQRAEELLQDNYDSERYYCLSDREKRQATLPISVFGTTLVEKFYSKQFADREDGLRLLREELTRPATESFEKHSANKTARAAIFLLHRALKDKVYAVYTLAADVLRLFFVQFVPTRRVASGEVSRSIERVLPELLSKSGDNTPRIHNMAVQTILDIADCPDVKSLNLIPTLLTKPLTNTTHPRLALSKMEMVEQLVLKIGISSNKQSGMTCRSLTEFGSSGLHHPSEPVRKVAERVLILIYHVNPRIVRKALPPDDELTRRNLLYRHLFSDFDRIDVERKQEMMLQSQREEVEAAETASASAASSKSCSSVTPKMRKTRSAMSQIARYTANSTPSPAHTSSGSSSASALTSPGTEVTSRGHASPTAAEERKSYRMCIFCKRRDPSFTEQGLNVHYWKSCPMLTRCNHCRQVIEVACLTRHLLEVCEVRRTYRKCRMCLEAISVDAFEEHIISRRCALAVPESKGSRCPFCHLNIPPWEDGWRAHLTGPRPCAAHPRLKQKTPASKIPKPLFSLTGSLIRRSGNTPVSSPKGTPRSKRKTLY
ncbi:centrosomal protein of 104 kDa isoform X2 [Neocloeon triangulifer]|uniref:centrosomal protein of 104 kDa isoform X2 n=1 Tax=Neocloeon triangulifer TaxID=2078957 RepID=UPI00286F9806|nr:centrosomal protein of 104 kDa isoform X2 [Neocloeon triangulifer]